MPLWRRVELVVAARHRGEQPRTDDVVSLRTHVHREDALEQVAAIGAGTLDSLPHNGAIVTLLAVCRSSHRESYFHIAMTAIVGPIVALVAVIVLAGLFGSF
jgi:H+/gluconate symporter-like permease